jgi:Asp-tRNA(Asn)/Glu-tRNA(Gln) amidotransferase A subunit family amidase
MPLAVQIVGRPYCDHEVAAVAHALEEGLRG